jgi:taurine dioxygenase
MANWTISKMSGHCGATLTGLSLNEATTAELEGVKDALFAHGVVVLPAQFLTPLAHVALAEFFGQIDINRFFTPVAQYPMIAEVRTAASQNAVIGGTWHTDHSYDPAPAMCSILSAQQLPPYGGDTHFASMTEAYTGLSDGLRTSVVRPEGLAFRWQFWRQQGRVEKQGRSISRPCVASRYYMSPRNQCACNLCQWGFHHPFRRVDD